MCAILLIFLYVKMHFNVLSPLVKAIMGKKFIGSFYCAISVILSILYVDWLRRGSASLYPGGDKMHTGRYRIIPQNGPKKLVSESPLVGPAKQPLGAPVIRN